jgi:hypothetical protein
MADSLGDPLVAQNATTVYLSSSGPSSLQVQPTVTIQAGAQYAIANVQPTVAAGGSTVTAVSPGFGSASTGFRTFNVGANATQLGVFLAGTHAVVSLVANTLFMVVQLETSRGTPAVAKGQMSVILSFSNSSLLQTPMNLTVPSGSDLVYANVALSRGTTGTFTAIATGFNSGSAPFSASKLQVSSNLVATPQTIQSNQPTTVTYQIQSQGVSVSGATVTWTATGGRVSPVSSKTDGTGSSSVTFIPSSPGIATVTAVATDPVVGRVNSTVTVIVIAAPMSIAPTLISTLTNYLPYIGAGVAAAIVVVIIWRRRRRTVGEEESFDIGEAPGAAFDLSS